MGVLFLPFNYDVGFGNAATEHLPNPYNSTVILEELYITPVLEAFKLMPSSQDYPVNRMGPEYINTNKINIVWEQTH